MTTAHQQILAALDAAQNRLTVLLLAEHRNLAAIIEAADAMRRAERQAAEAERRPVLTVPR